MTYRTLLGALSITLVSLTAFAGKDEREYMKSTLAPAIKQAETTFKTACGCPLTITLHDTSAASTNDMYVAKHIVDKIADQAPTYCNDAPSKKAVCQMKALEIKKGEKTAFEFKAGKAISTHDGQSYYDFERMAHELDK